MASKKSGYRAAIRKAKLMNLLKYVIVYSVLLIPLIPILSMIAWLIVQSFSEGPTSGLIPRGFTFENFRFLWHPIRFGLSEYPNIWPIVGNSLILAVGTVAFEIPVAALAGYALSRMKFPGRVATMKLIVALHAFPGVILLIALFYILNRLGLYGKGILTLIGVALVKAGLGVPMDTWILKGFFDGIPWELEWAAMVDGCSRFQTWRKILLPIITPGISAVAIFSFMGGWGEFLLAYTYIKRREFYPISVFLYSVIGEFVFVDWGLLAAVALFYMIPILVFYALTQKTLLKLQLVGAVKG
ncbi:MAG: sugar ABC transporter permease [Candidatus Bathyarchaeota archaeon B24]|nr:MAG: sugar ABC transporter permease [Candidatus Bathyarchaeota archaeon B24]